MSALFTYVGGQGSPYRAPCGGWATPPRVFLANPWSHYRTADSAIPRYQNTTVVPAGYCSEPSNIAPYTRGPSGCTPPPECGQWCEPPPANTYALYEPSETVNAALCRKIGYKYIVAMKAWHGRFGYTDLDYCCAGAPKPATQSTPSTTKYLTQEKTVTSSYTCLQDGVEINSGTEDIDYKYSVGRYTGKISQITCTDTITTENPEGRNCSLLDMNSLVNGDWSCGAYVPASDGGVEGSLWWGNILAPGFTPWNGPGEDSRGVTAESLTTSLSNTSFTMTYSVTIGDPTSGLCLEANVSTTWTLSDPYTNSDVNSDVDGLLGWWDLADDTVYPWRTDAFCTHGPLVSYFENAETAPPTAMQGCPASDTSPPDGSILGKPKPAGYDPYFDFRAQVFGDGVCSPATGYGQFAPSWAPHATQWTNDPLASVLLPGRFAAYNSLQSTCGGGGTTALGSLIKSKYAEVLTYAAPSHNFARPCGPKDAATHDQTTVDCTSDGHGGYVNQCGNLRWPGITNPCTPGEWFDDQPKGDYCLVSWSFNYRDDYTNPSDPNYRPVTGPLKSNSCAQECLPFQPCNPAVIFLSDNGESSANSATFTMPAFSCDECYGSLYQQMPRQWMTDPLYQPPARPCTLDVSTEWQEDDGSGTCTAIDPGTGQTIQYYPQRPYEECLCAPPDGAPALPDGTYIHMLTVAELNAGTTTGTEVDPPIAGQCWMPWWTWAINRYNTVKNGGPCFSCDYADPLAVCADDTEVTCP